MSGCTDLCAITIHLRQLKSPIHFYLPVITNLNKAVLQDAHFEPYSEFSASKQHAVGDGLAAFVLPGDNNCPDFFAHFMSVAIPPRSSPKNRPSRTRLYYSIPQIIEKSRELGYGTK